MLTRYLKFYQQTKKLLQHQFDHGNKELTLSEMALKVFKHKLRHEKQGVDTFYTPSEKVAAIFIEVSSFTSVETSPGLLSPNQKAPHVILT